MRVEISDAVFLLPVDTAKLLAIFLLGFEERHRILLADVVTPNYDQWLVSLDEWSREICRAVINQSARLEASEPAHHAISIVQSATSGIGMTPPMLTLDDAYALLLRPYRLLLENGISDWLFLLAMATNEERAFLMDRRDQEWLEVESCGGITELTKRVAMLRKRRLQNTRCSVLFDSDAESPRQPSAHSNAAVSACGNDMHHYRLERRAIENYLPVEALRRWVNKKSGPERRARLNVQRAYERLPVQLRHHYHMKRGLSAPHGTLFQGLAVEVRAGLAAGFEERIGRMFEREVRETELVTDGGWQEVRGFVEDFVARLR